MDELEDHLSHVFLNDVAKKKRELSAQDWEHLHGCRLCTLRLASLTAVEADYEELRKKFSRD